MVNFSKIIKKIFKKSNPIKEENHDNFFVKRIIPNAKFGDIIVSKKHLNGLEKFERDILVVVGKTHDRLLCYYCETVDKYNVDEVIGEYRLFKDNRTFLTPFSLRMLDVDSFDKSLNSLTSEDAIQLVKGLKYYYNEYIDELEDDNVELLFNPLIRIRDIVSKGDNYYLVFNTVVHTDRFTAELSNEKFSLLPISNYKVSNVCVNSVKFDDMISVVCEDYDLKYVDTVSKEVYGSIAKKYYQYVYRKNEISKAKDNNCLKKGYIISCDNKYYYVYYVSNKDAYAFEIIFNNDDNFLVAGNTKFIPLFDNKRKINIVNDKYKFLDLGCFDEINKISFVHSNYLNNKKKDEMIICNYKVGDVLEKAGYDGLKFIFIGIYLNKIVTINFDSFINNGSFEYNEFLVDDNDLSLLNISDNEKKIINNNLNLFNNLFANISAKKRTLNK